MVVLVTGGAGFLGSHLVDALVNDGVEVRVVDDLSTGHLDNLAAVRARIDWHAGDLRDPRVAADAMNGVDLCCHFVGDDSHARCAADPLRATDVNLAAAAQVLHAAVRRGVRRLVLASSISVYGAEGPEHESAPLPVAELGPAAAAHAAAEALALSVARESGLDVVILRFAEVYGPRQRVDAADQPDLPRFLHAALAGERNDLFGDGCETRDYLYVEDAVRAIRLAIACPDPARRIYNIGSGRPERVVDALHVVCEEVGTRGGPRCHPPIPGTRRFSEPEVGAAERDFGFRAQVGLHPGIRRSLAWYQAHSPVAAATPGTS